MQEVYLPPITFETQRKQVAVPPAFAVALTAFSVLSEIFSDSGNWFGKPTAFLDFPFKTISWPIELHRSKKVIGGEMDSPAGVDKNSETMQSFASLKDMHNNAEGFLTPWCGNKKADGQGCWQWWKKFSPAEEISHSWIPALLLLVKSRGRTSHARTEISVSGKENSRGQPSRWFYDLWR